MQPNQLIAYWWLTFYRLITHFFFANNWILPLLVSIPRAISCIWTCLIDFNICDIKWRLKCTRNSRRLLGWLYNIASELVRSQFKGKLDPPWRLPSPRSQPAVRRLPAVPTEFIWNCQEHGKRNACSPQWSHGGFLILAGYNTTDIFVSTVSMPTRHVTKYHPPQPHSPVKRSPPLSLCLLEINQLILVKGEKKNKNRDTYQQTSRRQCQTHSRAHQRKCTLI